MINACSHASSIAQLLLQLQDCWACICCAGAGMPAAHFKQQRCANVHGAPAPAFKNGFLYIFLPTLPRQHVRVMRSQSAPRRAGGREGGCGGPPADGCHRGLRQVVPHFAEYVINGTDVHQEGCHVQAAGDVSIPWWWYIKKHSCCRCLAWAGQGLRCCR
ncbi:hypothetical protein COO60DRAFT_804617 [Scenedesmus sp. NREL 46B-D3]|nr:hypothetical protein COO60DRAFT_804617 [Scenedesmus sp. NREL 46B-D3]